MYNASQCIEAQTFLEGGLTECIVSCAHSLIGVIRTISWTIVPVGEAEFANTPAGETAPDKKARRIGTGVD